MRDKQFIPVKGMKDLQGDELRIKYDIQDTMRRIFTNCGYAPVETPIVENMDTLRYKGGSEIHKEIFEVIGQGNRVLGLRYDHTIPLIRFLYTNADISFPFKRYTIGPVFRDGPSQPEKGRFRNFTQCDIDIVGVSDNLAETELIHIAHLILDDLQIKDIDFRISNRKILNGILEYSGIKSDLHEQTMIILDKLDKIGTDGVINELENVVDKGCIDRVEEFIAPMGNNDDVLSLLRRRITSDEGVSGIRDLEEQCKNSYEFGIDLRIDPSLARGLDYYTGSIIEAFCKDKSILDSAIIAGGRYDNILGEFLNREKIPAVGLSFGLDRLMKVATDRSHDDLGLYIIPIERPIEAMKYAKSLRDKGLLVEVELNSKKKVKRSIKYAILKGYSNVGFIGETELSNESIAIKNLDSGLQEMVKIDEVLDYLRYSSS